MGLSSHLNNKFFIAGFLNHLFFKALKYLVVSLLKVFFAFEVRNIHHVPAAGPFIITANHFSFMDPPVLQAACPRRIIFMMIEKYYNPIWVRWFFKSMHCIPIREETPYNIGPLKKGLKVLRQGKVIGIFPEGGISQSGVIRDGRPGTLLLAEKSDAPILPAFISGTYLALPRDAKFFRKAKIKVIFGSPVIFKDLSKGLKGKEGLQIATDNLMRKIKELSNNTEVIL